MWQRTVDCLGVAVSIASAVPSIDSKLEALLRTYASAPRPMLRYELRVTGGAAVVLRDDIEIARYETEVDLVAGLELDLYPAVVRRAEGVVLHAGCIVGRGGRAIVFAGVSGAGKSTLMRALLAKGYAYLSEECVALLPNRTCRGLARALSIEDSSIEVPAGFTSDVYEQRVETGIVSTRLFHPPSNLVWRGTATPIALLALNHGTNAPNTLTALSNGEALTRLWPLTFEGAIGSPLEAAATFAVAPGFSLHTSTPLDAQRLVLALAGQLDVVPP